MALPMPFPAPVTMATFPLSGWSVVCIRFLLWPMATRQTPCMTNAEPLIHMSFCPDKLILAGFSSSFAPCPGSAIAGHYDDEGVIYLRQRVVNIMQSKCRVLSQKGKVL